jgi:hypothetical protein
MAKVSIKFTFDDENEYDNVDEALYNLSMVNNYRSALFEFSTFYQRFIKHRDEDPTIDEVLDMITSILNKYEINSDRL